MGLNNTPSGERVHIGIFGRRNAGKSSIINALTGQDLAIVSDVQGTTTDPVQKSMELLPIGPVVMIDTPGLDDEGGLGELRVRKAYQMLNKSDIALLIVDGTAGFTDDDLRILRRIISKSIPYAIVLNKCDQVPESDRGIVTADIERRLGDAPRIIWVSAAGMTGIYELKELIGTLMPADDPDHRIAGDLISEGDLVVLVVPVDKAAPKGRLILPQQQTIRDILDSGATALVVRDTEYRGVYTKLNEKPALVITDSQVFSKVAAETPPDVPFTSFSVLFARYKGDLWSLADGARALDTLKNGDRVLISEGCSHHRQCGDIGTEKLPAWIRRHSGAEPEFEFTSGTEFTDDPGRYDLIVHCGGCMLNEREMKYRIRCAADAGVPMTNYGTAIAHMNGILDKSLEVLRDK